MGYNANLQNDLDDLYFCLPIAWGEQIHLAGEFGIHRKTLLGWLKRLEAEGLAEQVSHGCWDKCYDWSENGQANTSHCQA